MCLVRLALNVSLSLWTTMSMQNAQAGVRRLVALVRIKDNLEVVHHVADAGLMGMQTGQD